LIALFGFILAYSSFLVSSYHSNDENPGTEMTITATVIIEDLHQFSTLDLQI